MVRVQVNSNRNVQQLHDVTVNFAPSCPRANDTTSPPLCEAVEIEETTLPRPLGTCSFLEVAMVARIRSFLLVCILLESSVAFAPARIQTQASSRRAQHTVRNVVFTKLSEDCLGALR